MAGCYGNTRLHYWFWSYAMKKIAISRLDDLRDRKPIHALAANVDLVVVLFDDQVSVFYGRCAHRGDGRAPNRTAGLG